MKTALQRDRTGYSRLVQDGHYSDAPTGLWGKFDHVRCNWENQITRFAVAPALDRAIRRTEAETRGVRIADLGCGAGEGLDLLMKVPQASSRVRSQYLLRKDTLDAYHGIDLCPTMVSQARTRFATLPNTSFAIGDLAELGRHLKDLPPFDLYYNSYGSLSHLDDDQLRQMIGGILGHQPGPCALLIDVHGQYSPEWPCYWGYSRDQASPRMKPYNMVWMYPEAERTARLEEQRNYRVRYWQGDELREFLAGIPELAARQQGITLVDRSILVGRHMDTGSFNPGIKPIRRSVNALFEFNHCSDPEALRADPMPPSGDVAIDGFFDRYVRAWNAVVDWYARLGADDGYPTPAELCAEHGPVPAALRPGMEALVEQGRRLDWLQPGDPQSNLLQPQFGLLLRQLEFHAQQGLGCGHGLLAVVELSGITEPR